jgi:hypothetical protein
VVPFTPQQLSNLAVWFEKAVEKAVFDGPALFKEFVAYLSDAVDELRRQSAERHENTRHREEANNASEQLASVLAGAELSLQKLTERVASDTAEPPPPDEPALAAARAADYAKRIEEDMAPFRSAVDEARRRMRFPFGGAADLLGESDPLRRSPFA